jgi:hypothetical protein
MFNVSMERFMEYAQHSAVLRELEADIKACADKNKGRKGFCANKVWYREFKKRLIRIVGDFAVDERLGSSAAYDVAYGYLYDLLPDCDHEGLICGG